MNFLKFQVMRDNERFQILLCCLMKMETYLPQVKICRVTKISTGKVIIFLCFLEPLFKKWIKHYKELFLLLISP